MKKNYLNSIWENVLKNEGETFYTTRNLPFTYKVIANDTIVPINRDGKEQLKLSKDNFGYALRFDNYHTKEFNDFVIGPSYVRGILEDSRI